MVRRPSSPLGRSLGVLLTPRLVAGSQADEKPFAAVMREDLVADRTRMARHLRLTSRQVWCPPLHPAAAAAAAVSPQKKICAVSMSVALLLTPKKCIPPLLIPCLSPRVVFAFRCAFSLCPFLGCSSTHVPLSANHSVPAAANPPACFVSCLSCPRAPSGDPGQSSLRGGGDGFSCGHHSPPGASDAFADPGGRGAAQVLDRRWGCGAAVSAELRAARDRSGDRRRVGVWLQVEAALLVFCLACVLIDFCAALWIGTMYAM